MDALREFHAKLYVQGDSSRNAGSFYFPVEIEPSRSISHLKKCVCDVSGIGSGFVGRMQLFVAKSTTDLREPTADAEREALETERLQAARRCHTIESDSYLLAVIDAWPPTQGKHQCPRTPTHRSHRRFTQLSLPRLLQRATSGPGPMLGSFES